MLQHGPMEVTEQQLDLFPSAKTAAVMSEIVAAFDRLAPDCGKCGGAMRPGVDCLKCADCGWRSNAN